MDADSIGGSVNLKTKSAFNQKGRLATYKAGTSYNTGRKTYRPTGNIMYSDLVGQEGKLGVMFNASYNWSSNPRDTIFGAWEGTLETNRVIPPGLAARISGRSFRTTWSTIRRNA